MHNVSFLKYATRSGGQPIHENIMTKVLGSVLQYLINKFKKHSFRSMSTHILGKLEWLFLIEKTLDIQNPNG